MRQDPFPEAWELAGLRSFGPPGASVHALHVVKGKHAAPVNNLPPRPHLFLEVRILKSLGLERLLAGGSQGTKIGHRSFELTI
jgi:hypothetical protein